MLHFSVWRNFFLASHCILLLCMAWNRPFQFHCRNSINIADWNQRSIKGKVSSDICKKKLYNLKIIKINMRITCKPVMVWNKNWYWNIKFEHWTFSTHLSYASGRLCMYVCMDLFRSRKCYHFLFNFLDTTVRFELPFVIDNSIILKG